MGKGKGTKTEQSQEIDPTMRAEAEKTSNLASLIAAMGFDPYKGNTTAAFTPQQEAGMAAADTAAGAFGMAQGGTGGMPVGTYDGHSGVKGYSAYDTAGGDGMMTPLQRSQLDEFYAAAGEKVAPRKPLVAGGGGKK